MISLKELAEDELIKKEYIKTVLLTMFKKICVKMSNNLEYKRKIKSLYLQTNDKINTTKIIMQKEFNLNLTDDEAVLLCKWIEANFKKREQRSNITTNLDFKKKLYLKQNGFCVSCGEPLGSDWSKIHVDHIIPFKLVGDELDDNYQDLCETCNECKGAKIDYMFKSLIKIN